LSAPAVDLANARPLGAESAPTATLPDFWASRYGRRKPLTSTEVLGEAQVQREWWHRMVRRQG